LPVRCTDEHDFAGAVDEMTGVVLALVVTVAGSRTVD